MNITISVTTIITPITVIPIINVNALQDHKEIEDHEEYPVNKEPLVEECPIYGGGETHVRLELTLSTKVNIKTVLRGTLRVVS